MPGLDWKLTMEMDFESIDNTIESDDVDYASSATIYNNINLFQDYDGYIIVSYESAESDVSDESNVPNDEKYNGAVKYIEYCYSGDDADYTNIIENMKELLGEPLLDTDILAKNVPYEYIYWKLDDEHCLLIERSNGLSIKCELIETEMQSKYIQCMESIQENVELVDAYDAFVERYKLTDTSIQNAIDLYGAEWSEASEKSVHFEESYNLLGYTGSFICLLDNPDSEYYNSKFIGQIESVSYKWDDDTLDDNAVLKKLSDIFGKYEESNSIYNWNESTFYLRYYPESKLVSWTLNNDAYMLDQSIFDTLNDISSLSYEEVDEKILYLPDFFSPVVRLQILIRRKHYGLRQRRKF